MGWYYGILFLIIAADIRCYIKKYEHRLLSEKVNGDVEVVRIQPERLIQGG